MLFENVWNIIATWFADRKERSMLIREFNNRARTSFVRGETPTALKASISRGLSQYRHEFSSLFNTGFRIQALTGRQLSKSEIMDIGQVVLSNTILVRHLIVLGWDTLEVHDNGGCYGCRWRLADYANIGLMLE